MKAAHAHEVNTGLNKKTGTLLVILFIILVGIGAGYLLVKETQNPQKRAEEIQSGPSCPLNGFTCAWNRQPGVSYHYVIKDDSGAVVKQGDIPASDGADRITINHTPESGKTYTCAVDATSQCGTAQAEKSALCSAVPQPTELPESPTPTPTVSIDEPEPSLTPTGTIMPSLTPTPSPTLPPNVTPTKTPTPTDIIIVNTTNTPAVTGTTSTRAPSRQTTLPASGIPSTPIFAVMLIGAVIMVLGLIL